MKTSSAKRLPTLALAALGVVYGDIGTSPLYALKEVFAGQHHPVEITPENILGILSLVFWTLVLVVTLKYVLFVMRADNQGEGGVMALMALAGRRAEGRRGAVIAALGIFGAALFYGDGAITPAISVLSAIEGLNVATPAFEPYVVPLSLTVLAGLFAAQKFGTAKVGGFFGPIVVLWFLAIGTCGTVAIIGNPSVLVALDPRYALDFALQNSALAFFALGAVFLAVTGAEALYADMGHFGRRPIQLAWFGIVMPALVLNYFGQGALLLVDPKAIENPFYLLVPRDLLYPMIALSTAATVIASQAVISGAFSMTRQAIQLGYIPRMGVQQTSAQEYGQIYVPAINWMLMLLVACLVVGFGSSSSLAAAYGIAVTGTMIITTIMAYRVMADLWHWPLGLRLLLVTVFGSVDLAFLLANMTKIADGGWFPLALAAVIYLLMATWKRGRHMLHRRVADDALPLALFASRAGSSSALKCPGTAVFMTPNIDVVPPALLHSLKHYRALHERVVLIAVETLDTPQVSEAGRADVVRLDDRFLTIKLRFGFMETPDVPKALTALGQQGVEFNIMETSFFLSRETLIPRIGSEMSVWREKLFIAMSRNAESAASYFCLPPNRVVELGSSVVL